MNSASNSDNESGSESDGGEPSLLAGLRAGHIGSIRAFLERTVDGIDESALSDDECQQLFAVVLQTLSNRRQMHQRDTRAPPRASSQSSSEPVVVKTLDEDQAALEEFAADVLGSARNATQKLPLNSLGVLANRESSPRGLTPSARLNLASRFLPNTVTGAMSHRARAFCGKFSRSGETFCSASQDGLIHLYHTDTWAEFKTLPCADIGWAVVDIDYSPNQQFVAYSGWSDNVHLAMVHDRYEHHEALDFQPGQYRTCMFGIRFSPDEREILAGCNSGRVIIYDLHRKTPSVPSVRCHDDDINSVGYLDDCGNLFATGSDDSTIKVWDRRTMSSAQADSDEMATCVGGFTGHHQGITCVQGKGDSRFLISNSKDQSMKLWDLRKMATPAAVSQEARQNRALGGDFDYRYESWRPTSAQRSESDHSLMTFVGHSVKHTLIRCDFAPDQLTGQRYVCSGSGDGKVYIFDALTGDIVRTLSGHEDIVRDVSWHPNLPCLVTASWDGLSLRYEFVGDLDEDKQEQKLGDIKNAHRDHFRGGSW